MKTQLTQKLRTITSVASNLSKNLFDLYCNEKDQSKATRLCAIRSVLDSRITHVQNVIYELEIPEVYHRIEQDRKPVLNYNFWEYSQKTKSIMKEAEKAVDQIMLSIKRWVEQKLEYQFIS